MQPAPRTAQPAPETIIEGDLPITPEVGRPYYESGEPFLGDPGFEQACGPGGCNYCGIFGCGDPCNTCCLNGMYVRAEYLLWGTRGMTVPPLVTTSPQGTARTDAGVLDAANTTILFGGDTAGSWARSGGRITFGKWFDPCQRLGVEADYFALDDESTRFQSTSTGNPILARPFFDVTLGRESAELIAFPNVITGTVVADHLSTFQGAGVRAVYNLCCGDGCGTSCFTHCPVQTGYRFDTVWGYRFLRLDDSLSVIEDLVSQETANPGAFFIRDRFHTENQFHGVDFGAALHFCKGCWTLDLLSKLALGSTHSIINISGSTVLTQNGQPTQLQGGILAQRSNIGTYEADEFAAVPELGIALGYHVNPCWRVTMGYTFIYWSRVARAGDQIDRDVNPNLFPPENPIVATNLRPDFNLTYADLWAQGLTLGLEGKW